MRRVLVLALLTVLGGQASSQDGFSPAIPEASGDPHPEGNAYMRRWHMTMMRHDRDETVYEGARDVNASLGQCFDCHNVRDEDGTPVTYADQRHFCRVCHDFTAVRVDCFDCHRSTPEGFEEPAAHTFNAPARRPTQPSTRDVERIHAYLGDLAATGRTEVPQ